MTERHPKAVDLKVGDTTYTLLYNLGAICTLRERGVDAFNLTAETLTDPRTIRTLLWGGMRKYHPEVTEEMLGEMLDLSDLPDAAQAFTEALRKASTKEIVGPDPR